MLASIPWSIRVYNPRHTPLYSLQPNYIFNFDSHLSPALLIQVLQHNLHTLSTTMAYKQWIGIKNRSRLRRSDIRIKDAKLVS